jgi:hypothetical protein
MAAPYRSPGDAQPWPVGLCRAPSALSVGALPRSAPLRGRKVSAKRIISFCARVPRPSGIANASSLPVCACTAISPESKLNPARHFGGLKRVSLAQPFGSAGSALRASPVTPILAGLRRGGCDHQLDSGRRRASTAPAVAGSYSLVSWMHCAIATSGSTPAATPNRQ